jgi:hypothetical protein
VDLVLLRFSTPYTGAQFLWRQRASGRFRHHRSGRYPRILLGALADADMILFLGSPDTPLAAVRMALEELGQRGMFVQVRF